MCLKGCTQVGPIWIYQSLTSPMFVVAPGGHGLYGPSIGEHMRACPLLPINQLISTLQGVSLQINRSLMAGDVTSMKLANLPQQVPVSLNPL